jgi:hypothetical protein
MRRRSIEQRGWCLKALRQPYSEQLKLGRLPGAEFQQFVADIGAIPVPIEQQHGGFPHRAHYDGMAVFTSELELGVRAKGSGIT